MEKCPEGNDDWEPGARVAWDAIFGPNWPGGIFLAQRPSPPQLPAWGAGVGVASCPAVAAVAMWNLADVHGSTDPLDSTSHLISHLIHHSFPPNHILTLTD